MRRARQRGALSLLRVALLSACVAGAAMAALWSIRHDRNLFAEGASRLAGAAPARAVLDAAHQALAGTQAGSGALRKCVIDGRTVVSNTDCLDSNRSSQRIDMVLPRGVEAPKVPPAPAPASSPGSDPALDRIIEKQLR
jgi:hypothetical protein